MIVHVRFIAFPYAHRAHDAPPSVPRRHRRFHDGPGITTDPFGDSNRPPTLEAGCAWSRCRRSFLSQSRQRRELSCLQREGDKPRQDAMANMLDSISQWGHLPRVFVYSGWLHPLVSPIQLVEALIVLCFLYRSVLRSSRGWCCRAFHASLLSLIRPHAAIYPAGYFPLHIVPVQIRRVIEECRARVSKGDTQNLNIGDVAIDDPASVLLQKYAWIGQVRAAQKEFRYHHRWPR